MSVIAGTYGDALMVRSWNPWHTLREEPWIWLQYAEIEGADACVEQRPDGDALITLDAGLSRRERRCALAHELVHLDLGWLWPDGTAGADVMRGEAIVHRIVTDRLVPPDELEDFARRWAEGNGACRAWDVAQEFDVTLDIADRALRALEQRMRGAA